MGEAKRRGTREQRVEAAIARNAANPPPPKPEPQYRYMLPYTNKVLNYLWGMFKVGTEGATINEIRAKAIAEQKRLQLERTETPRAKRERLTGEGAADVAV